MDRNLHLYSASMMASIMAIYVHPMPSPNDFTLRSFQTNRFTLPSDAWKRSYRPLAEESRPLRSSKRDIEEDIFNTLNGWTYPLDH